MWWMSDCDAADPLLAMRQGRFGEEGRALPGPAKGGVAL